ncbi:GGDEF domain-containing response regulator [Rhodoferax sp.]|uniref:putative bifunctional diguanylate cyclase/phosphodiesterase n=1 Tax=Rhodoferax sp. TaxID=50421 RepID=UPI001EBDC5FE|nr:GGDEF domain-containing response regulator [Rhodoferax sp.]MBT9507527.1 EAL domain-containing protein [Rhodoferax sp.]
MSAAVNKPRILVVEDETIVARDIQAQLVELGYEPVAHATRGEQAIALAGQLRPDLVLMDIQLAGAMDGIAAAQAIRARYCLPVVFLTAFAADDILERAKLAEPFGYILKPFSERELRTVLEMALYKYRADARLQESVAHTQSILDNMADGVITISTDGLIESFNQAACTVFGYAAEEVIGRNVAMLMPEPHHSHHDGYLKHYKDSGEARMVGIPREVEGMRNDGSIFPMNLSVSKITRAGHTTFIGLVRDTTQHHLDVEEIRRLAFYDPLTGLPNRRLLLDRLSQAMLTSARSGLHGALMFLDLDHFKLLNDSLGHDVGDVLLQQVASRLSTCVREGDSVARLGGDEFVVLLEALSMHDHEAGAQAKAVASKILDALGQPYSLREHTYSSTPSIGIVVFMEDRETMDDLIKKADVAMYQAKAAGRNTVRFFDPTMQAAASAYAALEKDLRRGLDKDEFVLHYQVQVRAGRHAGDPPVVTGVEALVRWNNATRGLVPPAEFIPLAEETGLILPLGQWVLETACAQLVAWAGHPQTSHWSMAVNVSASQFAQPDFVAHVDEALKKTGCRPELLKLELTESMLVANVDEIIFKMNAIKARGVSFSLDDFGTGYSSLTYLKRLPLAQLKIDQSFVRDVLTDPSDAVIARTIVALGHSLGMIVIAEGVETEGQREFLADIGCDAFQGYHFGRPVPPQVLLENVMKNHAIHRPY